RHEPGSQVSFRDKRKGTTLSAPVGTCGYVCPACSSPHLSSERQFNGMFRTTLGPVDPVGDFIDGIAGQALSREELQQRFAAAVTSSTVYLRPETAQAMFVQFLNVQQSMAAKIPF